MHLIAEIVEGRWHLGMAEPGLLGWATVAAYAGTFLLCVLAGRGPGRGRGFWATLAVLLLGLAINRLLDFQAGLVQVGRGLAVSQGWYADRRTYQAGFVLVAAVVGLVLVGILGRLALRRRWPIAALLGAALLAGHTTARSTSYHHLDHILNLGVPGFRLGSALQLAGLVLVGASAVRAWRPRPPGA